MRISVQTTFVVFLAAATTLAPSPKDVELTATDEEPQMREDNLRSEREHQTFAAVKSGNAMALQKLLNADDTLVRALDADGRTPLHWAARGERVEILRLLIDHGSDPNAQDRDGSTALHWVCQRGRVDAATLLIESGADAELPDATQNTPLSYALYGNHLDVLQAMVAAGVVPWASPEGTEILHRAAAAGHRLLVETAIARGAEIRAPNPDGGTLLHSSAAGGLSDLVRDLVRQGFDPNGTDRYYLTPLRYAANNGHLTAVQALVELGAIVDLRSRAGVTAYLGASASGNAEIAEWLASKGADTSPRRWPTITGEFIGEERPGSKAKVFAPGTISSPLWEHSPLVFSRDGREAIWSVVSRDGTNGVLLSMKMSGDVWPEPAPLPFSQWQYRDICPSWSLDGNKLFFASQRPIDDADGYNIWFVNYTRGVWSEPEPLPAPVNTGNEARLTVTRDDTIYFGSWRPGSLGPSSIYWSKLVNGRYMEPEMLPEPVNSRSAEMPTLVDPDGRFIVFESTRPGGFGATDFYISMSDASQTWGEPVNLGNGTNSAHDDWFGGLSPDGTYFFFVSNRDGNNDLYWVDWHMISRIGRPEPALPTQTNIKRGNNQRSIEPADKTSEPLVRVHYLGHASFILTFDNGISVLTDYGKSRAYDLDSPIYKFDFMPDVVTYSHEHEDHAGGNIPEGVPHVLEGKNGLSLEGIDIKPVPSHERSLDEPDNVSYLFTYKGIKILHLGDCQALMVHGEREEVRARIAELYPDTYDLVLVPIGFVSDIVDDALSFMALIDAKAFIPMHYWNPSEKTSFLGRLDDSHRKDRKPYRVVNVTGSQFEIRVPTKLTREIRVINLQPGPYESSE